MLFRSVLSFLKENRQFRAELSKRSETYVGHPVPFQIHPNYTGSHLKGNHLILRKLNFSISLVETVHSAETGGRAGKQVHNLLSE